MNNSQEECDKLQKLLKVKQHEVPPPGYFNNFSTRVIHGIESPHVNAHPAVAQAPWLRRFLILLESNPFAAGVFGASVCGLLISGIAWSQFRTPSDYSANSGISMNVADNASAARPVLSSDGNINSLAPNISFALDTSDSGPSFNGQDNPSTPH